MHGCCALGGSPGVCRTAPAAPAPCWSPHSRACSAQSCTGMPPHRRGERSCGGGGLGGGLLPDCHQGATLRHTAARAASHLAGTACCHCSTMTRLQGACRVASCKSSRAQQLLLARPVRTHSLEACPVGPDEAWVQRCQQQQQPVGGAHGGDGAAPREKLAQPLRQGVLRL